MCAACRCSAFSTPDKPQDVFAFQVAVHAFAGWSCGDGRREAGISSSAAVSVIPGPMRLRASTVRLAELFLKRMVPEGSITRRWISSAQSPANCSMRKRRTVAAAKHQEPTSSRGAPTPVIHCARAGLCCGPNHGRSRKAGRLSGKAGWFAGVYIVSCGVQPSRKCDVSNRFRNAPRRRGTLGKRPAGQGCAAADVVVGGAVAIDSRDDLIHARNVAVFRRSGRYQGAIFAVMARTFEVGYPRGETSTGTSRSMQQRPRPDHERFRPQIRVLQPWKERPRPEVHGFKPEVPGFRPGHELPGQGTKFTGLAGRSADLASPGSGPKPAGSDRKTFSPIPGTSCSNPG